MPDEAVAAYRRVLNSIREAESRAGRKSGEVKLVAVSKTHPAETILPVLEEGHRIFGENRVQEAKSKWPGLKARFPQVELHLIGPLQSNKATEAVALFDVIQSVDREKIAAAIAAECRKQGRQPRLFLQVNTGLEPQKAGLAPDEVDSFLIRCRNDHGLIISGLMCIPPAEEPPRPHFELLAVMARRNGLAELSMGMSQDFEDAIAAGATLVRVGSAIFGARG